MDVIVNLIDAISFLLASYWTYRSVKSLVESSRTVYFVLLLYYVIFILPVGIDVFISYPSYEMWKQLPGFYVSYNDPITRIVYDIWMIMVFQLIEKFGTAKLIISFGKTAVKSSSFYQDNDYNDFLSKKASKRVLRICFLLSIFPIFAVLIFRLPTQILYTPLWLDNGIVTLSGRIQVIYYYLQKITYISIVAALLYITNSQKNRWLFKLIMIPVIYSLTCLEAKRAIYAIVLIALIAHLLFNSHVRAKKFIIVGSIIATVVLVYFATTYMQQYRVYGIQYDAVTTYTQVKMDFMRDDRVKFIIYKALNLEGILQYPLQSYITQLPSVFPFEFFFPVKGYNSYFTAAVMDVGVGTVSGWVTTSIFDEALSNLGLIGVIIAPMVIGRLCRRTDECVKSVRTVSIVAIALLFMLNLGYIMWYLEFCVIILFIERKYLHSIRTHSGD